MGPLKIGPYSRVLIEAASAASVGKWFLQIKEVVMVKLGAFITILWMEMVVKFSPKMALAFSSRTVAITNSIHCMLDDCICCISKNALCWRGVRRRKIFEKGSSQRLSWVIGGVKLTSCIWLSLYIVGLLLSLEKNEFRGVRIFKDPLKMHGVVELVFCINNFLEWKIVMPVSQCIEIDITVVLTKIIWLYFGSISYVNVVTEP